MAIVNEVITQFSFEGSTQPLVNYNSSLGKSIGLLASMSAAIVGAAGAMAAFVTSTTQSIDPMIQLSRSTGVAIGAIQELGFAASVTGSDAQTLQGSIVGLSEKIGEAAQKGSEEFARLGISVRDLSGEVKTADQVLLEIGKRFNDLDLSLPERRSFAQSLGIDPSLVQLLSLTSSELDKTRAKARELGIVTKEQADAAASLNDSMTTLKFGLDGVRNSVAVGLAPQIEDITAGFIDFLSANRDVITNGISKVIEFTTALAKSITRLAPIITGVIGIFGAWKIASIGLGAVLATVFSPATIITAAIVGLVLIVDDLIVAFNGGKSVIAGFFQEFLGVDIVPILRSAVDAATALFSHLSNSVGETFSAIGGIIETFSLLFKGEFSSVGEFISAIVPGIEKLFDNLFGGLLKAAKKFGLDFAKSFIGLVSDLANTWSDFNKQLVTSILQSDFVQVGTKLAKDLTQPFRNAFNSLMDWLKARFDKITSVASGIADFFGFGTNEPETIEVKVNQQRNISTKELDKPLTLRDLPNADKQEINRPVTVREMIDIQKAVIPEFEKPSDIEMERVATVRDLLKIQQPEQMSDINKTRNIVIDDVAKVNSAEIPSVQNIKDESLSRVVNLRELMNIQSAVRPADNDDIENPVELMRNVSLINQFEQFGDVDAPEISPLELTRQIAINNAISSVGLNDAVMSAQGVLSIEARNQQRLLPQPQTVNNNGRSVTIEQNNEINVTSDNPRAIAAPITDALQSQLSDAEAQLRTRAI
ncbi:hypothetical protein [Pseudoalteromonas sp.]|uniref:hypothetical protein n=1 Tax=Pseudoalteromonas sp. TaxID=53249 RepID=UPI003D0D45A4